MKPWSQPVTVYQADTDMVCLSGGQWIKVNEKILQKYPWIKKYRKT